MTGRAAGYCAGYPVPGYMDPGPGGGFGGGRGGWGGGWGGFGGGRGRGWRWGAGAIGPGAPGWAPFYGPYAPPAPEEEAEALKAQAKWLSEQLEALNRRIQELEGKE